VTNLWDIMNKHIPNEQEVAYYCFEKPFIVDQSGSSMQFVNRTELLYKVLHHIFLLLYNECLILLSHLG
jgi:hypothetical protein